MKKILITLLIVTINFYGIVLAQDGVNKKTEKKILNESDVVYFVPGEKIYHLFTCEKLGNAKTGMPLSLAIKKGLTPCPVCIPKIEEKVQTATKVELESIPNPGFRGASWGFSQDQVIKMETNKLFKKDTSESTGLEFLSYKAQTGGLSCLIAYYFAENQLVEGRYIFVEKHTNRNIYIDDFKTVKNNLIEKYGKPIEDKVIWRNDLYKDDRSEWGLAVSIGHLLYEVIWRFKEMTITMQLTGDNYEITHALDYRSELPAHKELIEKVKKKAKKDIW